MPQVLREEEYRRQDAEEEEAKGHATDRAHVVTIPSQPRTVALSLSLTLISEFNPNL